MTIESRIREDTPRTLGAAIALWTAAVALAAASGAFVRFPAAELAALAGFVTAFAVLTARLDAGVRAALAALAPRALVLATGIAALALASGAALAFGHPDPAEALARWPLALAPLVAAPLAAVLGLEGLGRLAAARGDLRKPASKAPATRPAAT